jgi:hypothetical protein
MHDGCVYNVRALKRRVCQEQILHKTEMETLNGII